MSFDSSWSFAGFKTFHLDFRNKFGPVCQNYRHEEPPADAHALGVDHTVAEESCYGGVHRRTTPHQDISGKDGQF